MSFQRPIVLLIDEDPDSLEMYDAGLRVDGFHPVLTRDAASAAWQAAAVRPDVIVTDLQLFGASGWRVLESGQAGTGGPSIPVVLLTSRTDQAIDRRARDVGCAAVLTKPCLPDELAKVLREVLGHSQ
jgi:two-component system KDP operon response regulator KdpE